MDKTESWAVDRLAAARLLAELELEPSDELLDRAARHFSGHRKDIAIWATRRALDRVFEMLETVAVDVFKRANGDWVSGYSYAESQICGLNAERLIDADVPKPRSKGQILRTMMKQARSA